MKTALPAIALLLLAARSAYAAAGPGGDPLPAILEALVLVLVAARLGGALFTRFGQPAVLGELLAGIVLGNLPGGFGVFEAASTRATLSA
jgi:Kef-type K+ transport system membrane component KefB